MRKIGDLTVNDGKGLFDAQGLCDTLIEDCNGLVKAACSGQYIQFCGYIVQMIQKITNLKDGIKNDLESKNQIIEDLKRMNNELQTQLTGLPVEEE